ncbi:MAG: putative modification methylase [Prokaryotic dsDNA virus sp.]|nr:MAG: putative modification methylase [Prokaryotic dsDNA virus sp.]|tara:strand:- start:4645 stop:5826 length:1182 start_codon:yes stop_codon:yes gene_type:complete
MKQKISIKKIKPNKNNPRFINNSKFKRLVKSIEEFPQMLEKRPIIVDENFIVLGGNMRLKACKKAGLKEIWIEQVIGWSENQKKEFIIKDNSSFGEWDWDILANQWDIEQLEDWGLDIPEIPIVDVEAEEDDYQIPDEIKTDIVLGDLIEIGEHRLLCGDSTDSEQVAKLMNGEKADMVFTDPPYNALKSWKKNETKSETRLNPNEWFANDNMNWNDFEQFLLDSFKNFNSESVYICCDYRIYHIVKKQIELCNYKLKHLIVWKKNIWGLGKRYRFQHELIIYVTKENNSPFYGDNSQSDVWEVDVDRQTKHKTPKPIELSSIAIKNSSKIKMLVLDLFLGSGSTMVAAHQLKRKCYGMELDPKYCQVIIDRMQKLDTNIEIKINGKKYKSKN